MTTVLVVIPAHDEEDEIGACLDHVGAAVRRVLATPDPPRVAVRVAAHRCSDETYRLAVRALSDLPGRHAVVRDRDSVSVGAVRRRLVIDSRRDTATDPGRTWVLSTDADSRVPSDWIVEVLRVAALARVVAVAGLVELHGWTASLALRERYARLLAEKVHEAGHHHVYGANLAVRLDAYLRVGGFRDVHGEDQDLVDRLIAAGEPVLGAFTPVVTTSARTPGRAGGGLGALLQQLADEERVAREPGAARPVAP